MCARGEIRLTDCADDGIDKAAALLSSLQIGLEGIAAERRYRNCRFHSYRTRPSRRRHRDDCHAVDTDITHICHTLSVACGHGHEEFGSSDAADCRGKLGNRQVSR